MRMTPQERIRKAKECYRRAKSQSGLSDSLRAELRRVANNLVALNLLEAQPRSYSASYCCTHSGGSFVTQLELRQPDLHTW
jgi:phage terminase small subunit